MGKANQQNQPARRQRGGEVRAPASKGGAGTILLASQSPRRWQLVHELGLSYRVVNVDVEEKLPHRLEPANTAKALAKLKADAYTKPLAENEILLTADTIVVLDGSILGKPKSE